MKKQQGFTLIELLVVIAIIGLLSTLAVVALNNARMKSRDARRIADIKQMQTALELYYNDVFRYPAAPSGTSTAGQCLAYDSAATSSGFSATCPSATSTIIYMSKVPGNPQPADATIAGCGGAGAIYYTYTLGGTNSDSYTIDYCLGATTGGVAGNVLHKASPGGIQ